MNKTLLIQGIDELVRLHDELDDRLTALENGHRPTVYQYETVTPCSDEKKNQMSRDGWELYHEEHHASLPAIGKVENGGETEIRFRLIVSASFRRPVTDEPDDPVKEDSAENPLSVPTAPPPAPAGIPNPAWEMPTVYADDDDGGETAPAEPVEIEHDPTPIEAMEATIYNHPITPRVSLVHVPEGIQDGTIYTDGNGVQRKVDGHLVYKRKPGQRSWYIDVTGSDHLMFTRVVERAHARRDDCVQPGTAPEVIYQ